MTDRERLADITGRLLSQVHEPTPDKRKLIGRAAGLMLEAERLHDDGTRRRWPLKDATVGEFIATVDGVLKLLHSLGLAKAITVPDDLGDHNLLENYLAYRSLCSSLLDKPVVELVDDPNIVPKKRGWR